MVRFKLKIYKDGLMRLPKELREQIFKHGTTEIEIAPNYVAFVGYPKGVNLSKVIKSLEIIIEDLKAQLELEKEKPLREG